MTMTVTQVEAVSVQERGVAPLEHSDDSAHSVVSLGALPHGPDTADNLGNPAQLSDQIVTGLRDLLEQSEHINRTLGQDFDRAMARINAREMQATIGVPGVSGLMMTGGLEQSAALSGSGFGFGLGESLTSAGARLPGPAEMHPASALEQQWEKLRDEQDRAFIRYNEFAAYQLQSSELHKITDQLSQAVNTLVRSQ